MKRATLGGMVVVCAVCLTAGASAQSLWGIEVWEGDPDGLLVLPGQRAVHVIQSGTYGFFVKPPDPWGGSSDDLNRLSVDSGLGAVTVMIEEPSSPMPKAGCRDLGEVATAPGTTLTLHNCRIGRNAATLLDMDVDRLTGYFIVEDDIGPYDLQVEGELAASVTCRDLKYVTAALSPTSAAAIEVNGAIVDGAYIHGTGPGAQLGLLSAVDFQGDVTINADVGTLYVNIVRDQLTVSGNVDLPVYNGSPLNPGLPDISIGGYLQNGEITAFQGSLAVAGSFGAPAPFAPDGLLTVTDLQSEATIAIAGDARGDLDLYGNVPSDAAVSIGGDLLGAAWLRTGSTFAGTLSVDGDVLPDAAIKVHSAATSATGRNAVGGAMQGNVQIRNADFGSTLDIAGNSMNGISTLNSGIGPTGAIHVGGTLSGGITIGALDGTGDPAMLGEIVVDGECDLPGIILNGALGSADPGSSALVWIKGGMGDGFVTVDYDGDSSLERWYSSATIRLGNDPNASYHGNRPELLLYDITICKGDMDNDGDVDFFDIDPLVAAFGDGASYNAEYPGLAGSRIFHGDLNCDNAVNFFDIDPFIARLGTCTWECYQYDDLQGGGEGEQMMMQASPDLLAAQLSAGISAERLPDLIAAIEQLALNPPEGSTTDWSAVLAALAGI